MLNASGVQVHVQVHDIVCILYAVSYRRQTPTFSAVDTCMAQPEKGLFSNPPRMYPSPLPPPTSNNTCQSLEVHSWHECMHMYNVHVHVGCEWPYGA